ncbi:MAG: NfeD family protein, partial [Sciscionella sp.]
MVVALIWLILGVVLVAGEILSGDFVLLMLGIGG